MEAEAEEKAEAEAAELEAKAEEEKAAYDLCNEFRGIKNGGKNECFESTVLVFHLSIRDRHMWHCYHITLIWKETDTRRHYTASTTKEARHCLLVSRFLSTITTPAAVVCSNRRGVQR